MRDDVTELAQLLNNIPYPPDIEATFAALGGTAFFPGGTGILRARRDLPIRGILILGHNFGSISYYNRLKPHEGENLKTSTWRNLLVTLTAAGVDTDQCFLLMLYKDC